MGKITDKCFVCARKIDKDSASLNSVVGLPVCAECKGTKKEKEQEDIYLDSLADDLVCGCI